MNQETNPDAEFGAPLAAFKAGLQSQVPTEIIPGVLAHHKDLVITERLEQRLAALKQSSPGPENPRGTITVHTVESFAAVVNDNSDARTKIFADTETGKVISVFDFLECGGREGTDQPDIRARGWGQHTAQILFRESRKLKEWRKLLEWTSQVDFANFIEDHLEDVMDPSGQDLLTIATDLEANSTGAFKGRVNLDNGDTRMSFQNDTDTSVDIPKNLTLGIPLFEHGDRYKLPARLRFHVSGGAVKFKLLFTNLEDAKEQEFERIVQDIEERTAAQVYRGNLALPW